VRDARTEDARRRRDTTPGFRRPGTRLDDEGRMSLTPEALALAMGREARALGPDVTVIDAGCGAGGNTIGFALAGCRVLAIERDRERLALARHNVQVYGVTDRVRLFHGDATEAPSLAGDLLFVDPPWGAAYDRVATPPDAFPLLQALLARRGDRPLWAKVPPSYAPPAEASAEAWFGEAPGDRHRVKFVLCRWPRAA
jgi:SAM-dependent methyltransferase